ncbi:MAG: hypothetical protein ABR589_02240, partial [Chthoniobacterales bacterium]
SRDGPARTCRNLLITMGLGGLWHGASWNFLFWGLYHGVLLVLHRAWRAWRGEREAGPIANGASVALTFLLITLGWVMFRVAEFPTAVHVFAEMFAGDVRWKTAIPSEMPILLGITFLWLLMDRGRRLQHWLSTGQGIAGTLKVSSAVALGLLVIELFSRTDIDVPFIYFRF